MKRAIACVPMLCVVWTATAIAAPNVIRVDVTGLRNNKGQVLCDLFTSAEAFPNKTEAAKAHIVTSIRDRHAVCEFEGAAPGRYAIAVVHDENSNGRLDRVLGMPSEGVGASRDARGQFGPPRFQDAAFDYAGGVTDLTVTIIYLL